MDQQAAASSHHRIIASSHCTDLKIQLKAIQPPELLDWYCSIVVWLLLRIPTRGRQWN